MVDAWEVMRHFRRENDSGSARVFEAACSPESSQTGKKSTVSCQEQIHLARRLLDQGYAAPITVRQLSREVALSPYYLIRLFRRVYKQTPHQYLIQRRIHEAKVLLSHSDLSVTEICSAVGFESLGSFSVLFHRVAGISPTAYRRSSQKRQKSAYVPLCICVLHRIGDTPENENRAILEKPV